MAALYLERYLQLQLRKTLQEYYLTESWNMLLYYRFHLIEYVIFLYIVLRYSWSCDRFNFSPSSST
jgi:hypothetical protein